MDKSLDPMQEFAYNSSLTLIQTACKIKGKDVLMHESTKSMILPALSYLEIIKDNPDIVEFISKDLSQLWHYIVKNLAPELVIEDATIFDNLPITYNELVVELKEIYERYMDCTKCDDTVCLKHPTRRN